MGRNIGRIGGAIAGIIAIVFGILDLIDKVPSWILIGLGAVAVLGVLADYIWQHQGDGDDAGTAKVKQTQKGGGRNSRNLQAGRDINLGGDGSNGAR